MLKVQKAHIYEYCSCDTKTQLLPIIYNGLINFDGQKFLVTTDQLKSNYTLVNTNIPIIFYCLHLLKYKTLFSVLFIVLLHFVRKVLISLFAIFMKKMYFKFLSF